MITETRIILDKGFILSQKVCTGLVCIAALLVLGGCASAPPDKAVAPPNANAAGAVEAVKKPIKLGLALGGGAARGFAHVGVIAVLEEAGLRPQPVVGTSAGSLVAAMYASGKTSAQLQQTALNME